MDIDYWNSFYQKRAAPREWSTFAESVLSKIKRNSVLFELGTGNGRDAIYFAFMEMQVWASDLSELSITQLKEDAAYDKIESPDFIHADFTRLETPFRGLIFDVVYSRFSLHSIDKQGASRTLKWAFDNLKSGGFFFIEVRSVKDALYGKGTPVEGEKDAFIYTHYRRFIR